MKKLFALMMIGGALFVASCGEGKKTEEGAATDTAAVTTEEVAPAADTTAAAADTTAADTMKK